MLSGEAFKAGGLYCPCRRDPFQPYTPVPVKILIKLFDIVAAVVSMAIFEVASIALTSGQGISYITGVFLERLSAADSALKSWENM